MTSILTLHNISKIFQEKPEKPLLVLRNISLEIRAGEFFVFLGPSGSGKSTLLRIMSGLEKSFEGKLELTSEVTQSDFSFVFQQFALLPWLTVPGRIEKNIEHPLPRPRNKRSQEFYSLYDDLYKIIRP